MLMVTLQHFLDHTMNGKRVRGRIGLPVRQRMEELNRKDLSELLNRVWGLDITSNVLQPAAYLQHYRRTHNMLDVSVISIPDWGTFVDILDAVKLARNLPLHMIKEKLKATGSKWSVAADDDKAVYRAIEFSVQL